MPESAAAAAEAYLLSVPEDERGPAATKLLGGPPVLATKQWPTNAHLIADVAKLGYLDGHVLDATYGEGNFWTVWRPERLTTMDRYKPADVRADFSDPPFPELSFDSVVFDPPYKLSGTPALGQFDDRYGIGIATPARLRMALILDGVYSCATLARRYLLVKCQDQVVSGKVTWQTDEIMRELYAEGAWEKVDRFDFIYTPRPQRGRQVHARRNTSTLLVFERR